MVSSKPSFYMEIMGKKYASTLNKERLHQKTFINEHDLCKSILAVLSIKMKPITLIF